jgi:hypothetical protein
MRSIFAAINSIERGSNNVEFLLIPKKELEIFLGLELAKHYLQF